MMLSPLIVQCEMIWEHIEGRDLYMGTLGDGLGLAVGRQALIFTLKLDLCVQRDHQYSLILILKLFSAKPVKK